MKRGDVLVRFPHPSGIRGKKRPACLFIDIGTPDGQATGLVRDSVVSCLILVTVYQDTVDQVLGSLSPNLKQRLDDCLKSALDLS